MERKGWIALDIDGTTTADIHEIPQEVQRYLATLHDDGWQIFFITGRLYYWAQMTVGKLPFPFLFGFQNGADIIEMPSKKLVSRAYMNPDILQFLDDAYENIDEDFLIYSGFEKGDFCYYRPAHFSEDVQGYLDLLRNFSPTPWREYEVKDFSPEDTFPLIKCFGSYEQMRPLYEKLVKRVDVEVSMIRDPLCEKFYLILVTDRGASKGTALERAFEATGQKGPVIAAGDDFNDLPMLKMADIRIVMETAPDELKQEADIVAPPASECGLIPALKQAVEQLS